MKSPYSRVIALHACFLAGCAAASVAWNPARAHEAAPQDEVPADARANPDRSDRKRAVFVCRNRGVVIYSDLPCGEQAEARVLRVHEPAPGRAASTVPLPARATTRPGNNASARDGDAEEKSARCRRLRDQLERLDDRMRAGYPARDAAALWDRWRDLNDEIYTTRCRGT